MALAFLAKKSWHTKNIKNVEAVWLAEQAKEHEEKRLREFEIELKKERRDMEDRQIQRDAGLLDPLNNRKERLDWMYQQGGKGGVQAAKSGEEVEQDLDAYLLGKEYKEDEKDNKKLAKVISGSGADGQAAVSARWLNKHANDTNETFRRLHEDPMYFIAKQEKEKSDKIAANPLLARRLQQHPHLQHQQRQGSSVSLKRKREDKKDKKKKKKSKKSKKKKKKKKETEDVDDETKEKSRQGYVPVAQRGAVLFFCVTELANLDPMYQYSLSWFIQLFIVALNESEENSSLNERLVIINKFFTFLLYDNVCRSLFEDAKLLFSFMMTIKIAQFEKRIDENQWRFLISGQTPGIPYDGENPCPSWLKKRSWQELCMVNNLSQYNKVAENFHANEKDWLAYFENHETHKAHMPAGLHDTLNGFEKMCILRCLRPDKITDAIQDYVTIELGKRSSLLHEYHFKIFMISLFFFSFFFLCYLFSAIFAHFFILFFFHLISSDLLRSPPFRP